MSPDSQHNQGLQQTRADLMFVAAEAIYRNVYKMPSNINQICEILKLMANDTRLRLLMVLCQSEKSVGDLENELCLNQPIVSQQLARLRSAKLVTTRRDGQSIYYSIASSEVREIIITLSRCFG